MNLSNLQTFLAIVETGSLIRASEQLNVTQSTVTARLKTLEDDLGQTLFVRQKTGATLTARGVKLRRYAEVMVELWHQARQETALPEGIEALVNIGCHSDLRKGLGQSLLNSIRGARPNLAASAWSGSNADLTQWLSSGLIDLAVTYHTATEDGFRLHGLTDEPLVLVSSDPNSPMRFDPNYVFVEGGEQFGRDHAAYYADADTARLSFGSPNWALEHLLEQGGSAYLPASIVKPYLAAGTLHPIAEAPKFNRKTYLIVNEKATATWDWLPNVIAALQA
ncbi:LysR family transcriptional regulator [Amylibacter sp. IMCC11727]|uniref:LysR family transcriptional regulator n=1 Tax=Amylibacter sp. IMCC11727 TaxID=3039851 RepID=UPI00244E0D46|nr:LysR family transcriptional regulator [Amylibacter sp. IMCC11727]WGI21154.1 LysR family transcriptional regulator [Amylibacter sp. IMCC11727]